MSLLTPRMAVLAVFVAFGFGLGLWAGSIPTVSARSGINAQWLGYAITLIIAAVMFGMMAAAVLTRRFGLRNALVIALAVVAIDMAVLLQSGGFWHFMVAATLIGGTGGALDALMNAEGYAVEKDIGFPVLAGFHGWCSLAAAVCAVIGSYVSVNFGTVATAVLTTIGYTVAIVIVLKATPKRGLPPVEAKGSRRVGYGLPIILLALVFGLINGGETMAALFSSSFLNFQSPELAAYAGAGTTGFGLCQFVVRVMADRLRRRFSDLFLIEASTVIGAAGYVIIATSGSFTQSVIGFGVVGIGTACLSPCAFALAPRLSGLAPAQAFAALAVLSAVTRVPAPLGFGEIVERASYPVAFICAAGLFAAALVLAMWLMRISPAVQGERSGS